MMQRFRKIGGLRASLQAAAGFKNPAGAARFSTYTTDTVRIVPEQPKNDGFKYYPSAAEKERTRLMDENFQRVLDCTETSEEKHTLIQLLDPLPLEERPWRERVGFYDWRFAIPVSAYILMPFIAQEFIPFNVMMNVSVLFLFNSWLWYNNLAYRFGPDLDLGIKELLVETQAHDLRIIDAMKGYIADNEKLIGWEDEVKSALDVSDELTIAQVDVFNSMEGHAFRNNVALKLDALVSLEIAANQSLRQRMVDAVKGDVKTLFLTNKTAKENAMNQAIAILQAGQDGKMGKDVVGAAYSEAVKNYQENYAKLPAGTDDIILALEKDMAAVATPVPFEVTGGNVFETNLIRL